MNELAAAVRILSWLVSWFLCLLRFVLYRLSRFAFLWYPPLELPAWEEEWFSGGNLSYGIRKIPPSGADSDSDSNPAMRPPAREGMHGRIEKEKGFEQAKNVSCIEEMESTNAMQAIFGPGKKKRDICFFFLIILCLRNKPWNELVISSPVCRYWPSSLWLLISMSATGHLNFQ